MQSFYPWRREKTKRTRTKRAEEEEAAEKGGGKEEGEEEGEGEEKKEFQGRGTRRSTTVEGNKLRTRRGVCTRYGYDPRLERRRRRRHANEKG